MNYHRGGGSGLAWLTGMANLAWLTGMAELEIADIS